MLLLVSGLLKEILEVVVQLDFLLYALILLNL